MIAFLQIKTRITFRFLHICFGNGRTCSSALIQFISCLPHCVITRLTFKYWTKFKPQNKNKKNLLRACVWSNYHARPAMGSRTDTFLKLIGKIYLRWEFIKKKKDVNKLILQKNLFIGVDFPKMFVCCPFSRLCRRGR